VGASPIPQLDKAPVPIHATFSAFAEPLPADDRFSESFAELSDDRLLIGTPERIRDDLARYRDEVGITDVVLRLFGEKVLPAVATN
jgi:alkanesulfonate monooxygenase SsuD/methylene tetrahydromethanopterin reductase-like flavin-dependent oxidoreductase (luciferase family)